MIRIGVESPLNNLCGASTAVNSKRPRSRAHCLPALVGIFLVLQSPTLLMATDGVELLGVSTQAQTRGGADVAVGDTALSQVENPATLSLTPAQLSRFEF